MAAVAPTLSDVAVDFGSQVRRFRREAGLSLEALAEASALSLNYVRSIEAGQRDPSLSTILALAKGLNVEPADLLTNAAPLSAGAMQAARLFEAQSKPVQKAVLDLLRATRKGR